MNWGNAALYAVLTAIALAMVLWFAGFVGERLGAISWTLLIAGLCGGFAILIYLGLHWWSAEFVGRLTEDHAAVLARLRDRFSGDRAEPVTHEEMRAARADLAELAPLAMRYGRMVLTVLFLMGIMLELVTLANAAVMYLQAKRIEEQNALLTAQNEVQSASFLNQSQTSLSAIVEVVDQARVIEARVRDDLLSPFSILEQFIPEITPDSVRLDGFRPVVCDAEDAAQCAMIGMDALSDILDDAGNLRVTQENAADLRGYARLAQAAEFTGIAFSTEVDLDASSISEDFPEERELLREQGVALRERRDEISKSLLGVSPTGSADSGR